MDSEYLKKQSVDFERVEDLFDRAQLDTVSTHEKDELNFLLENSAEFRKYIAKRLCDETILRFESTVCAARELFEMGHSSATPEQGGCITLAPAVNSRHLSDIISNRLPQIYRAASIALVLFIGATSHYLATTYLYDGDGDIPLARSVYINSQDFDTPTYVAHIIQDAGSLWNTTGQSDAGLVTGEAIRLSEGIGKVVFNTGMELFLEGPAELVISADGIPILRHGRVYARTPWGIGEFHLATDMGVLRLSSNSSAGVGLHGRSLGIHCFDGDIIVDCHSTQPRGISFSLTSGDAKFVEISYEGVLGVKEIPLQTSMFAAHTSMRSDQLSITEKYAEAVKTANPIAYWRFEQDANGLIDNEIASEHQCRLSGGVKIVPQNGDNHAVEFGYGLSAGSGIVKDTFQIVSGQYSIELWAKPSHLHHGAMVGLVRDQALGYQGHGLLIELRGAFSESTSNAIRYLHRSPIGVSEGTDCFSSTNYLVRKWQHIVAVKDRSNVSLYLNGIEVGSDINDKPLDDGLSLVIGQLYSHESLLRPFIGQLDELAIYDYPLTGGEISEHYHLVSEQ